MASNREKTGLFQSRDNGAKGEEGEVLERMSKEEREKPREGK